MRGLDDSFFDKKLNPLFLELIRHYWYTVNSSKDKDPAIIQQAQTHILHFAFQRLLQPLYLEHSSHVTGTAFMLACVHGDGVGDYFSLLKSSKILKESHPELDIQVVYTHQHQLPSIDPAKYLLEPENIHDFRESPQEPVLESVWKEERFCLTKKSS